MYFSVSEGYRLYHYDYDEPSGVLAKRTTFLDLDGPEISDGLTVDAEGFVWIARWNGGRIERYTPDGDLVETVETPVERPSSIAFGGVDCDGLYITSARGEGADSYGDLTGALFRTHLATTGRPEFRSRVATQEKQQIR